MPQRGADTFVRVQPLYLVPISWVLVPAVRGQECPRPTTNPFSDNLSSASESNSMMELRRILFRIRRESRDPRH
jgi:hypothetical protein